ncbi:guanylate kinase [uncultured Clostridium sp.]|jgi:guanylate kinase|uniref:guanylate kinase n=1 Tax=uncultured Clostridium sp. TaxID=59620 RepID=UPI00260676F6|nr:guanylate kinase [uncultured Clostridium sp.]
MGKIFCIMGKSSSGKDTIFKLLVEENTHNLKEVVSYTTRPIRNNETHGVEYFFINKDGLEVWTGRGKVIEVRCYNTAHGEWFYSTIDDGQIDLSSNENYLIISTLESFVGIREYYGGENVLPVYIEIDDGLRLQRALEREREQSMPKYEEMCRRFISDSADFSESNLESAGVSRKFENYNLDKALDEIKDFIIESIE